MARTKTLKVYRTVAGFYDAYVAAPSQKAALEAWGSDRDLFARGIAEQVTDPALTAEPLAAPGTVVKHSRGTTAEQIAALPDPKPAGKKTVDDGRVAEAATTKSKASGKSEPPPPKPKPKPSSEALDTAEAALATTEGEYAKQARSLAEREAKLAQERRAFDRDRAAALEQAQGARDDARQRYDAALEAWRASRR